MGLRRTPSYDEKQGTDGPGSLEDVIGNFPTITTQGRDIALQDYYDDARDDLEYLEWILAQEELKRLAERNTSVSMGSRPDLPDDNEGTEVSPVGESPTPPPPTLLPPTNNRIFDVVAPPPFIWRVPQQDPTFRPDESGTRKQPIGELPVVMPPPPPVAPPPPPPQVCLPPPVFRCPC